MKKTVFKRIIALALVAVTVAVLAGSLTACIFNNGTKDELEGVYGVEEYFFRSKEGAETVYADKYDYFLLVIYKDDNVKVISRKTGEDEVSYDTKLTVSYGDSENKKVSSISLANFKCVVMGTNGAVEQTGKYSMNFYPMREDLVNRDPRLVKNSAGNIVSEVMKLEFHKMYERTTDRKIEKAKKKQIEQREERNKTTDSE